MKDDNNTSSAVKQAIRELRQLRQQVAAYEQSAKEPIAVVGVGLRFPKCETGPDAFWQLLRDGEDAVNETPRERFSVDHYYDPDPHLPGKVSSKWGGYLQAIDQFDPDFFGISPRESVTMDPQQRLLLEVSWEALEHSATRPDTLRGTPTGVFVGVATTDYAQLQSKHLTDDAIDAYRTIGSSSHSVVSGRLSYTLGLQGPSISVDTACSSSLVALHLACQSLRLHECRTALAGGVNAILSVENSISLSKAQMFAADGRCKTFDERADGFVRGEGCGMVVLKRLSDALVDGDRILALIRGSATNQDGKSSGLTAPHGPSQEAVIRSALCSGGVSPHDVSYIEAHGTGTSLGDPIEVQALANVFGPGRAATNPLLLGSVKANLGHLESAAGIAGVIKVVMALQAQQLPPQAHFRTPNPHIPWDTCPFEVSTRLMPWAPSAPTRIAGVSSFGFSGSNAHVVLEEAPVPDEAGEAEFVRPTHLLKVSARSDTALRELAERYRSALSPEVEVADVCHTANTGRADFDFRLAVVGASSQEIADKLDPQRFDARTVDSDVFVGHTVDAHRPQLAFLYTGQGSQYVNMGRQLFETQPVFRRVIERCDAILRDTHALELLPAMYPDTDELPAADRVHQTDYTQPALFALQVALSEMWGSWGVRPAVAMGHSIGEYAAACVAGVFSIEDGIQLAAERGRLMQCFTAPGAMAVVRASEHDLLEQLDGIHEQVSLAAQNGPANLVISGPLDAVNQVLQRCQSAGIDSQRLDVSRAFHSHLMDPILDQLEHGAKQIQYSAPEIAVVSNLTGELARGDDLTHPGYWRRHAREAVQFHSSMTTLASHGFQCFLELGPHTTLLGMGRECLPDSQSRWLPSLRRGHSDWTEVLRGLGALYAAGVEVDWQGFDQEYPRRTVALPTYPFERKRYWYSDPDPITGGDEPQQQWQAAVARGRIQEDQAPIDLDLPSYPGKWKRLDELAVQFMVRAFAQLKLFTAPNDRRSIDQIIRECRVMPVYKNLVARWLERLADANLLQRDGTNFSCVEPLPVRDSSPAPAEADAVLSDIPYVLEYVKRCGNVLAGVLTGRDSPLETLFPSGSHETIEQVYAEWAMCRYLNGIAAAIVAQWIDGFPKDRQLTAIELGSGVGSTTRSLLPCFPPERTTYCFTDLSEVFFDQARRRFASFPFVRYGLYDAERNPEDQGFAAHSADLVVASNVLHATKDLRETMANVSSLLRPGGYALLIETICQPAWLDMTFGLSEGWHRFDDGIRTKTPLVSAEQWESLLREGGFESVEVFPKPDSPANVLIQRLLLARAPEQSQASQPEASPRLGERIGAARAIDSRRAALEEPSAEKSIPFELSELPAQQRREHLVDLTRELVALVLRRGDSQSVGRRSRLSELGLDSLMAVELRNHLQSRLPVSLPATLIFDYPTIESIACYLEDLLAFDSASIQAEASGEFSHRVTSEQLEAMSDGEVEQMLLEKLKEL